MSNKRKNILFTLSLVFMVLIYTFNTINAQTINTKFGKNRVQFHEVFNDWWMYENDHYIIYWYGKERNLAKTAILLSQISYSDIERILDFKINKKIQLIIYSNISDLKQSNLGIKDDDNKFAGPGIMRFYNNRVIVYFNGNHNDLLKQIRKGTAEVFLKNMFTDLTFENIYKKLVYSDFPEWFTQGIIDFLTDKWTIEDDVILRNIFLNKKKSKTTFTKLNEYIPRLAGKSFFYFLSRKYGTDKISDIFYLIRISRDIEASVLSVMDKPLDQLFDEWNAYYSNIYQRYLTNNGEMDDNEKIFSLKSGFPFTSLSLSPNNKYLTYATNNAGKIDLYIYNIVKRKKKKILKLGYINAFQETDYNYPVCRFDKNSDKLYMVFEKKGSLYLRIVDVNTFKYFEQILAPEYNRIYSLDILNSKNLILNGNTDGYPDIYLYKIKTRQSKRLTHDFWDNLDATIVSKNGQRGILFSSNRRDTSTEIQYLDTVPPIGTFDLFFFDLENNKISRLTNTPDINERHGFLYNDRLYYTSDETGTVNIKTENIKTHKAEFVSDALGNILSFYSQDNNILYDYSVLCDHYLKLQKIESGVKANPVISFLKETDDIAESEIETGNKKTEDYDVFEIDSGLLFQSEFDDIDPSALKEYSVSNDTTGSKPVYKFEFERFNSSRAVASRLRFSFTDLITKLDNQPLFEGMEAYTGEGDNTFGQPMSLLLKTRVKDLFEDYFLETGIRVSSDLREKEYFSVFENIKHKIDWQYAFYRKTRSSYQFNRTNFIDKYKMIINMGQVRAKYPFDIYSSISLTSALRFDKNLILASDTFSLNNIDVNEQRFSLQLEYIFDNTSKIGVNSYTGNRSKVFIRGYNKMNIKLNTPPAFDLSKGIFAVIGFDSRHYFKVLGKSILAFRLSGQTSFGTESNLYFLGGMENWIFSHNDDLVPLPAGDRYAYRILVVNMRGFGYNARNGSSYILSNNEIRIPVFQYLLGGSVKKSFLRDFQITGFFDIGTAWRGLSPFSEENPSNTRTIEVPPSIKIKLRYYADPLLAGYGFGIRSTLLGYFLKFDYAWGIETRKIQKPVFYFTMGYDF